MLRNNNKMSRSSSGGRASSSASLLRCAFLISSLYLIVLQPLHDKAIEMAHLDPTEIIAEPTSLNRLAAFVGVVALVFIGPPLLNGESIISMEFVKTLLGTYSVLVLCGAHPIHFVQQTIFCSLLITVLVMPLQPTRMLRDEGTAKSSWILQKCQFHGMWIVALPFQILHILDHGAQIQQWPLPIVLGTVTGYCIGTVLGVGLEQLFGTRKYYQQ